MERKVINISEEQKDNLVNELVKLVSEFRKKENVECIYFAPYKGMEGISAGNILELVVVINGQYRNIDFNQYNKKYETHDYIRKYGIRIYISPDNHNKYTTMPLNPSEIKRANYLYNSSILFDKTGEYSQIKEKAEKHENMLNSNIYQYRNLAEIYPPIDSEIEMGLETETVKEFTKTKLFDYIKNM